MRIVRILAAIILTVAIFLVISCAHTPVAPPPVLVPVEVDKPVAGKCVPANMASAPAYVDTDAALLAAPDAAARYQLLYAGRKLRIGRLSELEAVLAGCSK